MGDAASKLVADEFGRLFENGGDYEDFLSDAFICAQKKLLEEQQKRKVSQKMKTTAVALVTDEKTAYIGHVGDSRIYVFRHNKVTARTLDHSVPQMLVRSGEIKESEIRHHPDRNLVLRVMGIPWEKPMVDLMKPISLRKCQAFLLCTDGFWELIEEPVMEELLKKAVSAQDWLEKMTAEVKKNGAGKNMDNYTAIAVWNTK